MKFATHCVGASSLCVALVKAQRAAYSFHRIGFGRNNAFRISRTYGTHSLPFKPPVFAEKPSLVADTISSQCTRRYKVRPFSLENKRFVELVNFTFIPTEVPFKVAESSHEKNR